MSVKETFEWKNIAVICIALLMTLLAVMTASGDIYSGVPDNTGINTYWGSNVTENVTMYDNTSNFLNFTLNDNAGNITWLNLTFPTNFTLPVNTILNYSLTGFVGLDATNITVTDQTINIANGTPTNDIWNTTNGSPAYFSINITNITFTGSSGSYEINATTNQTPDGKLVYLTVDGEPTVTSITFNQSVNTWVTNDTVLNFNASINDTASGVQNTTINITSLNSSAGIINLDFLSGYWMNNLSAVNTSQEGRHNITIVSYDNASQVNNTVNFSVWVDNTRPIVVANNYTAVPTWVNNNTLLMLNASIVDPLSGPYNATVNASAVNGSLTNAIILEHAGGDYWTNYTAAIVNITNQGQINLAITAYDNVSNMNNSVNFSVWVDTLKPIVTSITYSGAQMWVNNGTVLNLNMSVIDQGVVGVNASGVDSSQSYINISEINSTQTAILTNAGNYWRNNTIVVNTSNTGQVNLTIWAYDNATNVNSSVNFTMWVDNVAPSVTPHLVVYPVNMFQQTAVKVNDTIFLNLTATDDGGSGINISDVSVNVTLINDSGWIYLMPTGDGYWTAPVIIDNSTGTGTVPLDIEVYDNATNVNDTQSFEVELDNTPPMFNGTLPITAMTWDGNETEIPTGLYFYYDDLFYDSLGDNPNENITIQVNMTQSGLFVQANFSAVDGNNTWITAVKDGNLYTVTYAYDNFTAGLDARSVMIRAFDGAGNMNMSDNNTMSFNGPLPFEAIVNVTPDEIYPDLLDGLATTDWSLDIDDFTNATELTFENMSSGKIVFTDSINLCDDTILDALQNFGDMMQFADAELSLNTSVNALGAMNKSANLTMYNLDDFTSTPGIMMDGVSVVMSGQLAGGTVTNVNWSSSPNLTFSVEHWTSYSADGIPPSVIANYPISSQEQWLNNGSLLELNATIFDMGGAGVKNATVDVSNVNATDVAILNNTADNFWTNNSLIVATSNQGVFNLTITAYDNVSNMNNSVNMTVYVDNTEPSIIAGSPAYLAGYTAAKNGSTITFNATINDTLSGTASATVLSNVTNISSLTSIALANTAGDYWTNGSITIAGTDGTYIMNLTASDVAGNVNNSDPVQFEVLIDNTNPVIHNITFNPNTTSTYGANITVTVNVSDLGSGINAVSAAGEPLIPQSGDMWNGTISAGYGTNTVNVIATDNASNTNATSSTYTGPTAPTTSSDDGSSRGGRALLQTPTTEDTEGVVVLSQESKGIALSVPATTIAVDFTKDDIMSIEVDAKKEVSSVYITVQNLDGKPTSIPKSPSGSVHSYLNINVKDIDADNIAGADIAFKVEKKWLSQNNIAKDNVLLARFSEGVWQQLETNVVTGDDDFVYFSARTPGFSTFAIVAKDVAVTKPVDEIEAPVSVEETVSDTATEGYVPAEEEDNGLPGFEAIFAVMGLLLVTLLVRKQEKN